MPRIAIPMPHSIDRAYSERAIVQYERAVEQAGGEPLRIELGQSAAAIEKLAANCDAVLLPGSKADVDPAKYAAERSPRSASPDPQRDLADKLLLKDAYNLHKPVLGICYGLQSLNVFRSGSLIQHIPDFLPDDLRERVNHEAGRNVPIAHSVEIKAGSRLGEIITNGNRSSDGSSATTLGAKAQNGLVVPVNSSHHQSAEKIGHGLRVSARCPDDGIIEALEGSDPDHFVLAVQWHPERSVDLDEPSRDIFRALIDAAEARTK
jgi:putative glutamine amidotransferase